MGAYKSIALRIFGSFADRWVKSFAHLKPHLIGSGIGVLPRTWICMIFLSVVITYIVSFIAIAVVGILLQLDFVMFLYLIVFIPVLAAAFSFITLYLYPMQKARSIEKNMEIDLPFALAHMYAIASSGIPPEFMFDMLIRFEEYKAISGQAKLIVQNIKTYGMSSVAAMKNVAKKTPSKRFKQILRGMASTIERGGNLVRYLKMTSDKELLNYRIKRENYLKTLSTYADIYTALLVAAPLMMLAVLGIMAIIGGEIMGLSIKELIDLITWVLLPFLNVAFLAFIHITYPGV